MSAKAPALSHVLETSVYVDDMERARAFYETVMGLEPMVADARLTAYDAGNGTVFLMFKRGETLDTVKLPGGTIPPHDGHGPLHMAFAVAADDLAAWEKRLTDHDVAIEGRTDWPKGGKSIYFRDPDGHLLELATPGLWANY